MSPVASAPGKVILCGEHAVVYGAPAIALPLSGIRAYAKIVKGDHPLTIIAEDLAEPPRVYRAGEMDMADPLALMARLAVEYLDAEDISGAIRLKSDIPIASGLGSGAAVSTALGRAIAMLHVSEIPDKELSQLVYEVEKLHHGTPSGIDNTVVVYEAPVYFIKDHSIDLIKIAKPLQLVLAETGIAALTRDAVAAVRRRRQSAPAKTAATFAEIGAIANEARDCLASGATRRLGELMTANHRLLQGLDVSSPELDRLVAAGLNGGAYGAKLSGGGRGGNIIALVDEHSVNAVRAKLLEAGAKRVMVASAGEGTGDDDDSD